MTRDSMKKDATTGTQAKNGDGFAATASTAQAMRGGEASTGNAPASPSGTVSGKPGQLIREMIRSFFAAGDVPELSRDRIRQRRREGLDVLLRILSGLVRLLCAFLLGRTAAFFGVYPFGLAYLCCAGKHIWFVCSGVLLSTLFLGEVTVPYAAATIMAMALRFLIGRYLYRSEDREGSKKVSGAAASASLDGKEHSSFPAIIKQYFPDEIFDQSLLLRLGIGGIAASVAAIGEGMCRELPVQFILIYLILFLSVGLFTYLFSGALDGIRFGGRAELGYAAILFALTLSLAPLVPGGISVQTVFAFLVTLYVSKNGGLLRGGITGLLVGLACDATYAPLFALGGLVSGLLWQFGTALPVLMALLCAAGYAIYIGEFTALRGVVPDLICAAAIYYPLSLWEKLPKPEVFGGVQNASQTALAAQALVLERKNTDMMEKMDVLSGVLTKLSETFFSLSVRAAAPAGAEIGRVCGNVIREYCSECNLCRGKDFTERENSIAILTKMLAKSGRVEGKQLPAFLRQRCRCLDEMTAALNYQISVLYKNHLGRDKTGVFAEDYENMANLLTAAIAENNEAYRRDTVLAQRMQRALEQLDFRVSDFAVLGSRRRTVIASGIDMHRYHMGTESLRRALEQLAGVRYATPLFSFRDEFVSMTVESLPAYSVAWGMGQGKKANERVGGDAVNVFCSREDYFYAMVSDGMGSGRQASITAQLSAMFTEQMLAVGNSKAVTLNMLNHFLRSRQIECTTTVDLAEIDLITGTAAFVKSGAAPSYVLRGDKVFRIGSETVPVGILKELGAQQTKFTLQDQDVIVLVSDGVAPLEEDGVWLTSFLTYEMAADPKIMAKRIVHKAEERTGCSDDLSCIVLRINAIA